MSSINQKLGLKPAGARRRLDSLSGVRCPNCGHTDTLSLYVRVPTTARHPNRLQWTCRGCGQSRYPTVAEVVAYNQRVRPRDQIEVPSA